MKSLPSPPPGTRTKLRDEITPGDLIIYYLETGAWEQYTQPHFVLSRNPDATAIWSHYIGHPKPGILFLTGLAYCISDTR